MKRPYSPRQLVKRLLRAVPAPLSPIEAELRRPWFQAHGVRTVIDVGANEGQFASVARRALPTAQVLSFEPLPRCAAAMRARFVDDRRHEVYEVALGASTGDVSMYESEFSQSSSLLPMGEAHQRAFPHTRRTSPTIVREARLDDLLADRQLAQPLLLKLDVQGYEAQVLDGGPKTLAQAQFLLVELSLEPLYEGEPLFDAMYRRVHDDGFELRNVLHTLRQPSDQRPLQVDALFERRR